MRCLLFYIIVRFFIISSCLSPFSFDFSVPFICYLALWFQVHVMASSYDVTSMDIFPNTWNWSKAARVIMLLCKAFHFSMSLSYLILVKCRDLHVSAARAMFFGIILTAHHEIPYSRLSWREIMSRRSLMALKFDWCRSIDMLTFGS